MRQAGIYVPEFGDKRDRYKGQLEESLVVGRINRNVII
jgi:hypothetical protein